MSHLQRTSRRTSAVALALVGLLTSAITFGRTAAPVEAVASTTAACPAGSDLIESDPAPTTPTCFQIFTTSGTFTTPADVTAVDVLVVGGGGGGAQGGVVGGEVLAGGGGGGGGVDLRTGVAVSGDVTVIVGAGGTGGEGAAGGIGGTSSFGAIDAVGGAGGSTGTSGPVSGDGGASGDADAGGSDAITNFGFTHYYSGGGGGGGAGGAGGNASISSEVCHVGDEDPTGGFATDWVCGGDGGTGLLPTGGGFTAAFWTWIAPWPVAKEITTYGFGPGGAGAVAGLWRDNGTSPTVYFASGRGVDLTGVPVARGVFANGADAYFTNVQFGQAPGVPDNSSSAAFGWDSKTYGGGGSGGTGAGDGTTSNPGSAGTDGVVIVTFPAGEVTGVESTTTYTGTTGDISAGTLVELSATVDPGTCVTDGLFSFFLVVDDGEGGSFDELIEGTVLDTSEFESGTYEIEVEYAGDGTCLASTGAGSFTIVSGTASTVTYTGTTGTITAGTLVELSATVDPGTCVTEGLFSFYLVVDDGEGGSFDELIEGTVLDTSEFEPGTYEILVVYAGDGTCLESTDFSTFTISTGEPLMAGSTTGGGSYDIDLDDVGDVDHGRDRVHFGFTVQNTEKFDRRSGIRQHTQRGQLLWISNDGWRLKASLAARWSTGNGETTGDIPVFGVMPCPSFVGVEGSNPECGTIRGYGVLQYWDDEAGEYGEWVPATQFGEDGWVGFSADIGDGGSVKVCKQRRCTIADVADWFGLSIDGVDIEDGVPVGDPVPLRRQRNGGIVIRS